MEVASIEEIAAAINILSPVGTALCMAAAANKDHEKGKLMLYLHFSHFVFLWRHYSLFFHDVRITFMLRNANSLVCISMTKHR